MSMNSTPSSDRIHIGIFGRRNAGKSSIINALTGQDFAIVSEVKGTTTDPVIKAMELLPLGPVVIIDTPGLDDEGALGELRVHKAYQMLNRTDIALLVIDGSQPMTQEDHDILKKIQKKEIPYLIVANKADLFSPETTDIDHCISVSALTGKNIDFLKESIGKLLPEFIRSSRIVGDLVQPLDLVLLVVPVDSAAPKGRLILPQQQTIRDLLEADAISIVVKDSELSQTLQKLETPPDLVITDSQVFAEVDRILPKSVPLTSFSILFARHRGGLNIMTKGVHAIDSLKDGDTVLISEGCTHHRQCDDIGTVKLPRMLKKHTGKDLKFEFTSGTEFPDDLSPYTLAIHCGGCMINPKEMQYRLKSSQEQHIPMTNYGIALAHMNGILERSLSPLL
ncbi:[FeFe] hydrogenase H-cluster maturation GTPase HydF [Lachnospiraceae bacterium OttesenSCG-928-E19]|nr:[FeFe] hydrogenase H-cluster maturation GTPase HydF [Lachnospiraceae bacterium OttesenSCG-928-E19]